MISWLKRRKMNIKTHSSPDLASRSSAAAHLQTKSISPDKEIEHYKSRLLQFGIKIYEMPKLTPQSKKSRLDAYTIASYIANNTELKSLFLTKKGLPASQLSEKFPSKSIRRYTPYIIAVALIIIEDYEYLKGYLPE
ncbi:hypothetical protein QUF79_19975 [Fictibacillus enclensis]|uniref:hypothetical protein n=1 Tax=Fictibacillus enclensis TaxID=1017270 RepID=UPI0025A2B237|nr:hypothetical protein [Fictibacillus enclensis]MDM5200296.1 hypothetical protein [Fictibacillus enclensis]